MSHVTNVTLMTAIDEPAMPALLKWCEDISFFFKKVDQHYGGTKWAEIDVHGGAFNYFPGDEFIARWRECDWQFPESCVLVIHPQEGEAIVMRPGRVSGQ